MCINFNYYLFMYFCMHLPVLLRILFTAVKKKESFIRARNDHAKCVLHVINAAQLARAGRPRPRVIIIAYVHVLVNAHNIT